ncbi:MAG: bacterial Ig-like domain-containing protein [Synergistaceae bacterium]|uniref:bacterial Ig-like domain-containing protein n=1 Tax=Succinivibrio sp. TaxID=2053619 RepID=UPI0025D2FAA0|nr:bacterial Ig-like domain-containing protein [Succinivibrio sp.]MBQ9222103.1 bacterial Ig-like domain-containing protein [Succinivibrio sp.]MBR1439386.1 bacterial Ig-like domain-containing protein [Synergistaceae bacterium]
MPLVLIKKAFVNAYLQKNDSDDFTLSDPLTPYIEDFNCGWVGTGNGIWTYEKPSQCYSDIYQVLGGHKYFLTLGEEAGTRFRIMFTTTDVSTVASGTVSGKAVNTSNYNNPSPYQNVYYTTPSDGYIVFQKDNAGKSGIKTYLHDTISKSPVVCYFLGEVNPHSFNSEKILQIVEALKTVLNPSVSVKAVKKVEGYIIGHTDLAALTVTQLPSKTQYRAGELADYTGIAVTATYENGSIVDVTDKAVFSPAHGETVSSPVFVAFKELSTSFNLDITGATLTDLLVTPPSKTTYLKGEVLDFTGCTVTAVYGDGSTKDVTNSAVFSPANGTVINSNNSLEVDISYSEDVYQDGVLVGNDTLTSSFPITVAYLNSLSVTAPTKTHYIGDALDYTGLTVTANYKNSSSVDVTSSAVITPAEGTIITTDMVTEPAPIPEPRDIYEELKINVSYSDSAGNKKTTSITIQIPHLMVTVPNKTEYHVGETIDYTGLKVELEGVDITSSVTFQYPEGSVILSDSYSRNGRYRWRQMYIYYTDNSGENKRTYIEILVYPE